MKLGVTGHRPNKLWGYNLEEENYEKLISYFKNYILSEKVTDVYDGMALGLDTVVAMAVLSLKEEGYDIKLHACIPCAGQESRWNFMDRIRYANILSKCDEILAINDKMIMTPVSIINISSIEYRLIEPDGCLYQVEYRPYLMQERNKIIVNNCDTLIALWDGSSGGTANCVNYAKTTGRVNVHVINPRNVERW